MTPFRRLSLAVLLALAVPAASAATTCEDACKRLIGEAHALSAQGKHREALAKYEEASRAAPQSSIPPALAAGVVVNLAESAAPEQRGTLRELARKLAGRALGLASDDPVALEVVRLLDQDAPSPLRNPNPAASRLMAEAEAHFARRDFQAAIPKYEAAMQADPAYSGAVVGAGDCYFLLQDWVRAEALFRRAVEIEPRNAQAWRFLADTYMRQGKVRETESALLSAIAANPGMGQGWRQLADIRAAMRMPLAPLALRRGVRAVRANDGKYTLEVDEADTQAGTLDAAFRLSLGLGEVQARQKDSAATASSFEIELAAWRTALKIADELKAKDGKALSDPALLRMQAFAQDGQLEPAILLLLYRESYRPALEAWIAANPGGVKAFIDRYGVRP